MRVFRMIWQTTIWVAMSSPGRGFAANHVVSEPEAVEKIASFLSFTDGH
jgi:hypothetical protein